MPRTKTMRSNRKKFYVIAGHRLLLKLRNMQFDMTLTQKQRKLANELYKEILYSPKFPDVSKETVNSAIKKVQGEL